MTPTMNLRLLLLTLAASLPILSIAQVGTGVVFYTEACLAFVPTTVDSTSVISIELGNEVGVAQTVSLLGLDGPFSLLGPSAVTIESEASTTLNVSLLPCHFGRQIRHVAGAGFRLRGSANHPQWRGHSSPAGMVSRHP